ncbi:hypothetical protein Nmel_004359, partial [Mimus melanotis]
MSCSLGETEEEIHVSHIYNTSVQHWPLFLSSIQRGETFLCAFLCLDLMSPPKASFSHCICHPVGSPLFNPCGKRLQAFKTSSYFNSLGRHSEIYALHLSAFIHPEFPAVYSTHTSLQFHHSHNAVPLPRLELVFVQICSEP